MIESKGNPQWDPVKIDRVHRTYAEEQRKKEAKVKKEEWIHYVVFIVLTVFLAGIGGIFLKSSVEYPSVNFFISLMPAGSPASGASVGNPYVLEAPSAGLRH